MAGLLKDIGKLDDPTPPAPVAPAPASTPAVPATPAATVPPKAGTEPTPAPLEDPNKAKEIVVKKAKSISDAVEESVRKVLGEMKPGSAASAPAATPPAATPAPTAATVEDEFEKTLTKVEKDQLAIAEHAENQFGKTGLKTQFKEFFKRVDSYVAKAQSEDPARSLDKNDEEFVKFIEETRPAIDPEEWNEIRISKVVEDRLKKAEATKNTEVQGKLDEANQRLKTIEMRPVVEQAVQSVETEFGKLISEDKESPVSEVADLISKKGLEQARKEDPELVTIVENVAFETMANATEYMAIKTGLKPIDMKNDRHVWLATFVQNQSDWFEKHGGDRKTRTQNGVTQTFLPTAKYFELSQSNPTELSKHFTLTDQEILKMLSVNAKMHADALTKKRLETLTTSGFVRNKTKTPAVIPDPPKPSESPKAGNTPAPGAAEGGSIESGAFPKDYFKSLGIAVPV